MKYIFLVGWSKILYHLWEISSILTNSRSLFFTANETKKASTFFIHLFSMSNYLDVRLCVFIPWMWMLDLRTILIEEKKASMLRYRQLKANIIFFHYTKMLLQNILKILLLVFIFHSLRKRLKCIWFKFIMYFECIEWFTWIGIIF